MPRARLNVRNRSLDVLAVDFVGYINWIPFSRNPGLISFAYVLARACLATLLLFLVLYFAFYDDSTAYRFSAPEVILYTSVFAVFEEQARWIYADGADSKARSSALFAGLIVAFETSAFFIGSGGPFLDYAPTRVGAVLVHVVNAILCRYSLTRGRSLKYLVFALAVGFHVAMNMAGSGMLYEAWFG